MLLADFQIPDERVMLQADARQIQTGDQQDPDYTDMSESDSDSDSD